MITAVTNATIIIWQSAPISESSCFHYDIGHKLLIMLLVVSVFCLALLQNKPSANYVVAEIIGIKVVMIPLFMIEDFVGQTLVINCGQKQGCSMAPSRTS